MESDEFGDRDRFGVVGLLDVCAEDVLSESAAFLGDERDTSSTVEIRELCIGTEKRLVTGWLTERVGVAGRSREYRNSLSDSRALSDRPSVLGEESAPALKLCRRPRSDGTIRRLARGEIIYGLGLRLTLPPRPSRRPGVVAECTGLGDCILCNSLAS
jgi:hypothetical protein